MICLCDLTVKLVGLVALHRIPNIGSGRGKAHLSNVAVQHKAVFRECAGLQWRLPAELADVFRCSMRDLTTGGAVSAA